MGRAARHAQCGRCLSPLGCGDLSPVYLSPRPAQLPGAFRREDAAEPEAVGEDGTLCVPRVGPVS